MKKEKTWSDSNLIIDTELLGGSASENLTYLLELVRESEQKSRPKSTIHRTAPTPLDLYL